MSDLKLGALTKGFQEAGHPDADVPRLVEEHLATARLPDNGEGGVKSEIRMADGTYADPTTAK